MKLFSFSILAFAFLFGFSFKSSDNVLYNSASEIADLDDIFRDCAIENSAFHAGEKAVYTVYYKIGFVWLSAGEVTFTIEEDDQHYHFKAYGRTYASYDPFFRVRDTYKSKVDKRTMLPMKAIRDINEGSYSKYSELTFDYEKKIVTAYHGRSEDQMSTDYVEMDRCLHDVLSIIYYSRNMDIRGIRPNDVVALDVCFDDKIYNVGMKFLGRERNHRIRRAGGNFDLLKFSPGVIAGKVFEEGSEMTVWVSDDKNRIPVQIESPLKVGAVRVVLNSYEGLKHPFTAKR